ncbi:hypothetical protein ICC18_31060 [Paenibacillus sp. WST5]|uniref:Uncharacterized protein n=2 Tax=Paenibacillus sedimenti TaxID=2770274 RepID=A0A926KUP4_9BACL|nr:hypothetical protein [Paenibacillus sedimenti]
MGFSDSIATDYVGKGQDRILFSKDITSEIISTSTTCEIMVAFGKNRLDQQLSNPDPIYQAIDELEDKIKKETDEKLKKEMQWENASDREYMKLLPNLVYTLPTITFDQQMSIQGSDRTVQLITYGGGHTQSDAFVYLPEEKIAVKGDLVLSKHSFSGLIVLNSTSKAFVIGFFSAKTDGDKEENIMENANRNDNNLNFSFTLKIPINRIK